MAQWALSAKKINVAFYCQHIAVHTVEENDNVEIYGPVIMNAEVISYKKQWDDVKIVGISQGREREKRIAQTSYPQIKDFRNVTQKGILYTMEDDQVDAVIQDLTKAAMVPKYQSKPLSGDDYISYVLVVDKEFRKTKAFEDFVQQYNKAVDRLNRKEYLAQQLGVNEKWLEDKKIQFLKLE